MPLKSGDCKNNLGESDRIKKYFIEAHLGENYLYNRSKKQYT